MTASRAASPPCDRRPRANAHWLLEGVGANCCVTEVPQIQYMLPIVIVIVIVLLIVMVIVIHIMVLVIIIVGRPPPRSRL